MVAHYGNICQDVVYEITTINRFGKLCNRTFITNLLPSEDKFLMLDSLSFLANTRVLSYKPKPI